MGKSSRFRALLLRLLRLLQLICQKVEKTGFYQKFCVFERVFAKGAQEVEGGFAGLGGLAFYVGFVEGGVVALPGPIVLENSVGLVKREKAVAEKLVYEVVAGRVGG